MSWVAVGVAGVSAVGAIASADKNRPSKSNQLYESNLNQAGSSLLERGQKLADRPYTPYRGERVAGLSQNENMAMGLARTAPADSRTYLDKAGAQIDSVAGSEWNADTAKKYMDPYVGGVVNTALRNENTAYQQDQNDLRAKATSQGAFGGSRATLLEAAGTGKHLQAVGDITTAGYSAAYKNAFSGWQADNDRKLGAARAYQSVGGDIAKLNSDQIQDLMQTGGADRVLRQITDDTNYQAFIEKRDWDVSNLQPLIQSIAAARGGNVQRDTSKTDAATSALGSIASLVGYYGSRSGGSSSGGATAGSSAAASRTVTELGLSNWDGK